MSRMKGTEEVKSDPGLLVFDSTNIALKTENILRTAKVPCAVIPTPVEISSECGIALLVKKNIVESAMMALEDAGCKGYKLIYPFQPGHKRGPNDK